MLPERPPPAAEATAYYVIAEGLTNVSRHAAASRATVLVRQADGHLVVEVQDDGRGGASIGAHDDIVPTGLRGLSDRVAGVDGELVVTSPPGGPTVIRATVPCAHLRGSSVGPSRARRWGTNPTVDEVAEWWEESRRTAFREQVAFRNAFPGHLTLPGCAA